MINNPYTLQNKTILITGASRGIGRATAIECSKLGAKCILVARNEDMLKSTIAVLEGNGHKYILADLSNENEIDSIISEIDKIQGIVFNAGIMDNAPLNFLTTEKINNLFSVNVISPMLFLGKLIKSKKLEKNSSVVYLSSINGTHIGSIGTSVYSSTKGAIRAYVRNAALELASKAIRVNAVCPGMIDTGIMKDGAFTDEQFAKDALNYPLKRYGKPEEVAYSVVFLLSDAASFITGSEIVIDGGFSIQ